MLATFRLVGWLERFEFSSKRSRSYDFPFFNVYDFFFNKNATRETAREGVTSRPWCTLNVLRFIPRPPYQQWETASATMCSTVLGFAAISRVPSSPLLFAVLVRLLNTLRKFILLAFQCTASRVVRYGPLLYYVYYIIYFYIYHKTQQVTFLLAF